MHSEEIRVESGTGPVMAIVGEAPIDFQFASGRRLGAVVGIYEPRSGLFWWLYSGGSSIEGVRRLPWIKESNKFYLADSNLVSFSGGGQVLFIRESTQRVASLQEGIDSALASVKAMRAEIEAGTKKWFTHVVDLDSLDRDFFFLRGAAITPNPPTLKHVSFAGARWRLTIDGPNGDIALVVLNDKYSLVSARFQPVVK